MSEPPNESAASSFDPASEHWLRDRFCRLWQRNLERHSGSDPQAVWEALRNRYAEPHRHYHDEHHLTHCLAQLDLARDEIRNPDAVEMAIWFHDVINAPGRQDNETRSAAFFRDQAKGMVGDRFLDEVVDLILVTDHRRSPHGLDHQFICDIDLSSFGCPWECYLRDTDKVRAEFPGPEDAYYRGKRSFLEALLRRSRIFQTDFFNSRYEQQARENIERLLELIDRGEH